MPLRCPSLRRRHQALTLGKVFARSFAANSAGLGKGEIVLFRAMEASLKAIANPPHVVVEEYHGAGHQVTFIGSGSYSRTHARCELSDLLVIVYDRQTKDARLTFIQAKSERTVPANLHRTSGAWLAANLEQWDLLARRPRINGVGSFSPPPDLLSSAKLDSIGGFVFFLHGSGGVHIHYAAASDLRRPPHFVSRYGKLIANHDKCRCGRSPECLSVYGNAEFGTFLFGLMIGTPILKVGMPTTTSVCSWLASQLRGFVAQAGSPDTPTALANELAGLLGRDSRPPAQRPNVGAANLLIVGIEPEDRRRN